jgi:hypothetical protein
LVGLSGRFLLPVSFSFIRGVSTDVVVFFYIGSSQGRGFAFFLYSNSEYKGNSVPEVLYPKGVDFDDQAK